MKRQLQIKDGKVQSEWQGSGAMPIPPDASWTFIDVTERPEAHAGMLYDAATDTFTAPPAPPDYGRSVSTREFLLLFTATERKAIRAATTTDEDVADWYALALGPNEAIRLQHPTTLAGLEFLVAQGLLTPERKVAITTA